MAFAQPILKSGEEAVNQTDMLVYIDNSYSMSNEVNEGVPALDAGLSYVNELTRLFPSATNYRLLTNDFEASGMVPKSKTELSDLTTELEYSSAIRSFEDVYNRIQTQQDVPQNIYWISDFQKSTSSLQNIDFDSIQKVNLVPLQFMSTDNVAVDSVWLENPFLIGDEKLQLNVKVRNYGLSSVEDLIVKVFVDDVQSATASINIAPNTSATTTFDLAFQLQGINRCKVSFEEFPVTFDNEFYFTINGSRKIDVLEIKDTDQPTSVTQVYGNEELFKLTSVNISNLDYSLITENDFVIVNGIAQIDPSLTAVINEYVGNYGRVLIIPSAAPDLSTYKQIQGLQLLSRKDSLIEADLATPDFNNPFFENVFEEESQNFAMPFAKKVLDWGRDRAAVLSFENGEPFLSKRTAGGEVYVMASPLKKDFTTFYSHALFVPVMYRLAVESASLDNKLYYFIDDPILSFKADTLITDEIFKLRGQEGEIIPSQRIKGNTVNMEVPKNILESGFYELMLGERTINTFAFNKSFNESDLEQYGIDEVKSKFQGNVSVFDAADKNAFAKEIESRYIGQALWKYALILALLFLLTEVLLIRFFP